MLYSWHNMYFRTKRGVRCGEFSSRIEDCCVFVYIDGLITHISQSCYHGWRTGQYCLSAVQSVQMIIALFAWCCAIVDILMSALQCLKMDFYLCNFCFKFLWPYDAIAYDTFPDWCALLLLEEETKFVRRALSLVLLLICHVPRLRFFTFKLKDNSFVPCIFTPCAFSASFHRL